jgi:type III secretion protein S
MNTLNSLSTDALLLVFWLSLPPLVAATVTGLVLALLQSITQIQDQSLPYGAKIVCVGCILMITGPWALRESARLLEHMFVYMAGGRLH